MGAELWGDRLEAGGALKQEWFAFELDLRLARHSAGLAPFLDFVSGGTRRWAWRWPLAVDALSRAPWHPEGPLNGRERALLKKLTKDASAKDAAAWALALDKDSPGSPEALQALADSGDDRAWDRLLRFRDKIPPGNWLCLALDWVWAREDQGFGAELTSDRKAALVQSATKAADLSPWRRARCAMLLAHLGLREPALALLRLPGNLDELPGGMDVERSVSEMDDPFKFMEQQ